MVSRDDVVVQRPEDLIVVPRVFHTYNGCCGAATAYILRRVAYVAGAYAPGIHDQMFHELNSSRVGGSLEKVQSWFEGHTGMLSQLGYRLNCRRVAIPTAGLLEWVRQGRGYRGAMLPTTFRKLHTKPGSAGKDVVDDLVYHAVGVVMDRLEPKAADELVMIDPWPGIDGVAKDRDKVPAALDAAHRDRGLHSLTFFWAGWS